MGKVPRYVTDSDETDDVTSSSLENMRKRKKFSILKCTTGSVKKKKCKLHSKSEPSDYDCRSRSRSNHRMKHKLSSILKYDRDRESSDEDEDSEPLKPRGQDRCLVGRVPRPAGAKPGRGGGVAIVFKKNTSSRIQSNIQPRDSTSGLLKRKRYSTKRLMEKRSDY